MTTANTTATTSEDFSPETLGITWGLWAVFVQGEPIGQVRRVGSEQHHKFQALKNGKPLGRPVPARDTAVLWLWADHMEARKG